MLRSSQMNRRLGSYGIPAAAEFTRQKKPRMAGF
jgi:hypothetical protein